MDRESSGGLSFDDIPSGEVIRADQNILVTVRQWQNTENNWLGEGQEGVEFVQVMTESFDPRCTIGNFNLVWGAKEEIVQILQKVLD